MSSPVQSHAESNNLDYLDSSAEMYDAFDTETTSEGVIPGLNLRRGYDQMKCREMIATMIIVHGLPFSFVEYEWFNIFMKYNNPFYHKVSRATIKKDCMKVFKAGNVKLKKIFENVDRISLTSDCWTSNQTIESLCLTAHYIDSDWKLQKRIVGFNELAPPYGSEELADGILEILMEWGIQDKIGAITLDNGPNNDMTTFILKSNIQERGKLHFEGSFFHVRCCAHILNLVVQDGLSKIECCVLKIREAVKYLRGSPARLLEFGEIAMNLGIQTSRSLCTDVKSRWNSTHRMLESALHYKFAFHGYSLRDSNFEWQPTEAEWVGAEKVCKLLEVFSDVANLFSGKLYPTSNLFLVEVFRVKKVISEAYTSDDVFLNSITKPMYEKFEKYWEENRVFMSMASILDPRFKLVSVEFAYKRLYPIEEVGNQIEEVTNSLKSLYENYLKEQRAKTKAKATSSLSSNGCTSAAAASLNESGQEKDDFYAFLKTRSEKPPKSDLEVYLEQPIYFVRDKDSFDALKWWSQNTSMYPILSKLACDVLCIPMTTVDSESVFSAGGRLLDDYQSSLRRDMMEILVCGGDWIKAASKTKIQTLQQAAKEEENLEIQVPMSKLTTN